MEYKEYIIFQKKPIILEPCPAEDLHKCKYGNVKECKFDKSKCFHIEERNRSKKIDKTAWKVRGFIGFGILFYVLASVFDSTPAYAFTYSPFVYSIISGISISIIAGALLTYIIDIPSKLKEYETSFLNALSSNSYLRNLDENQLIQLRKDLTEQLHVKNAPFMAKGLIDIDQRVCDLLKQPYYTRYRQSVICSDINEDDRSIAKKHMIDYCLKNPYGKNKEAVEYIGFSNLILKGNEPDGSKFISDIKIEFSIDGNDGHKISEQEYVLDASTLNDSVEFYDTKIILYGVDNQNQKTQGIKATFKDQLEVHIEYNIKVPKDDICFSKRLRHPVRNFRLDYSYNSPNVKLYGQLFGTEIKQSDISVKYMGDNNISLETFDWLLPDNGAIVVMTKK